MTRIDHFEGFKTHAMLGKVYARLTADELVKARMFIHDNRTMGKGDFEMAVNRMFLGDPLKPTHWKEIMELLTCANSALKE